MRKCATHNRAYVCDFLVFHDRKTKSSPTVFVIYDIKAFNFKSRMNSHLVHRHWGKRQIIPESVPVPQISHGISLLAMNEHGEEDGVSHKENGGVVAHQIPDSFFGVKFQGKTCRQGELHGLVHRLSLH